jgi:DNA-binding transcriptional ArsR family regulator
VGRYPESRREVPTGPLGCGDGQSHRCHGIGVYGGEDQEPLADAALDGRYGAQRAGAAPRAASRNPVRVSSSALLFSWICIQVSLYRVRVAVLAYGQVLARFGHALSDPTRARVLLALREAPAYPADLADLIGVSRQVMSNHLACLRGCGLVVAVPDGRRSRYELADERLAHALGDLLGVVLAVDLAACPDADRDGCC